MALEAPEVLGGVLPAVVEPVDVQLRLEVLDGGLASERPAFGAGNVLGSMRTMSALAVVDMASEKVDWALIGSWRKQHDPSVLPGGSILIFDNNGNDALILSEFPGQLAVADINCVYAGSTVLQEAIGKSSGGRTDFKANGTGQIYFKGLQGAFKF